MNDPSKPTAGSLAANYFPGVAPCQRCKQLEERIAELEADLRLANLIIETEPKGTEQ